MKKFMMTTVAAAILFMPTMVQAEVERYSFDTVHTQVLFFVSHLGFSFSEGEFLDFDGGITFDRTAPEKSAVNVTIETASIDMDDEKWDNHMKNADFFNVENFPTMTFDSTGIEVTGEDTANITGDLTLLGVTNPVVLATKFNNAGKHPFGDKYAAGFSATGHIKRSDFGMNYGLPNVGDDVEIRIEVEAVREEVGGEVSNN